MNEEAPEAAHPGDIAFDWLIRLPCVIGLVRGAVAAIDWLLRGQYIFLVEIKLQLMGLIVGCVGATLNILVRWHEEEETGVSKRPLTAKGIVLKLVLGAMAGWITTWVFIDYGPVQKPIGRGIILLACGYAGADVIVAWMRIGRLCLKTLMEVVKRLLGKRGLP